VEPAASFADRALVIGADGCRSGWVCVLADAESGRVEKIFIASHFAEIVALPGIARIAVDMPIGIPAFTTRLGRVCDSALRRSLGARQPPVFSVPPRPALPEPDYRRACEVSLLHSDPPRMVSKQCFHIFPKIREIDALMTPELQTRVAECHPEGA